MNETKRKTGKIYSQIDRLAKKGKDQLFEYYKLIDEIINKSEYGFFEQTLYIYYNIDPNSYRSVDEIKKKTWPEILFQTNSSFQTKLKKIYDQKKVYQTGFEIYSIDLSYLQITTSSPMSQTFSVISTTQSVSFTRTDDFIYFNTTDSDIFKLDLYKTGEWIDINGVSAPSSRRLIEQISVTQSSTKLQIPTTHEGEYLVSVNSRSPLVITNYKVSLSNDSLLGQIKEYDIYNPEVKYLVQNIDLAKAMGQKRTNLDVIKNNVVTTLSDYDETISEEQNLLNKYTIAIDILLT
jgi:hypothetical protein